MATTSLYKMLAKTLLLAAVPLAFASPAPIPQPAEANSVTGLVGGLNSGSLSIGSLTAAVPAAISDLDDFLSAAQTVEDAISNGTIPSQDVPAVVQKLFQAAKPTGSAPSTYQDAMSKAASAWGIKSAADIPGTPKNILQNIGALIFQGITSSDVQDIISSLTPAAVDPKSNNPAVPRGKRFYNNVPGNAPFSVPEKQLRAAMYIPPAFEWGKGKKQPIVLSPGTGGTGWKHYHLTIGKLLSASSFADPIYLNIPNNLLDDAQLNAEYVAYALQYMYALTKKKPAIVTFSQGSINAQWALKYWPSTRKITTDYIALSPDYHGTIIAYGLCSPGATITNQQSCTPSVFQQTYNSNFINKLRSNDGDSAYVPTTTVYSGTDEIVQPQQGTRASGFIKDARGVGTTNIYLQEACFGQPAGSVYLHEGIVYNPLAYAILVDALTHDGPGKLERVKDKCAGVVTEGLSVSDVVGTEALIPLAALNIVLYQPKVATEPAIKGYAR